MPPAALEAGALYIVLFARSTPNDYHWALYHHFSPTRGAKFHIRNICDAWIEGHEDTSGIHKEFLLMGFNKIAQIPGGDNGTLRSLVASTPFDTPGVTCRTWVLDVIRACIKARLVRCLSLDQLEQETKAFGFAQFDDTANNVQPRPVVK
ncbi:hypothetical protein A0H81_10889 [Grifola frondosa]|uniref:Uncharacterized protein n=1 Tax=Grifola frondosa TaxID=5627 RepID=A0A1C7LZ56_GRIFR|nr:hypothetical protein A0H81_10889 [Grifola frondosa]